MGLELKNFILKTNGGKCKYAKNWQNAAGYRLLDQNQPKGNIGIPWGYSPLESRTNPDNFYYIYKFGIVL